MKAPHIRIIDGYEFISYHPTNYSAEETLQRSREFHQWLDLRRTVRDFSDRPIQKEVIENILRSASTACTLTDRSL